MMNPKEREALYNRPEKQVVDFNLNVTFRCPVIEKLLETKIVASLQEINDKIDGLVAFVKTVDESVEKLFELVKDAQTGQDIKPEVADAILAKLTTLQDAADKISDDDPDQPPVTLPDETPPTLR